MEENNKHIDDLYREELGAYHEAPRDIVWDRIENNLDKIATRKRGNYNFLNRRLLFLTLGLALISSATYVSYTLSKKKADNSIANSETRQKANNTQELNTVIKTPANPGNVINDAKQGDETTPSEKSNKANHIPIQNITTKKSSEKQNNLEAGSAIKKEIVESSPKKNSVDNKLTAVTSSNISSPTERNINRGVLAPDNITANKDSRTSNADFKTIHHSSTITNIVSDNNSSIPMLSKRAPVNFNAYTNENQKTLNQEYKTPSPLPSINGSAQQSINNSTGAINALTPNAINKQEITSETISGKSNTTQELQATNKRTQSAVETTSGDNQPLLITDNTKEKKKPGIQIGTKIGLEMGFGNYASDKITGAAYASLNLSDKLCLMIQPGIKIARLNQTIDYGTKPYIANGTKAYNDTLEAYGATHAQDLYYFHYYQVESTAVIMCVVVSSVMSQTKTLSAPTVPYVLSLTTLPKIVCVRLVITTVSFTESVQ